MPVFPLDCFIFFTPILAKINIFMKPSLLVNYFSLSTKELKDKKSVQNTKVVKYSEWLASNTSAQRRKPSAGVQVDDPWHGICKVFWGLLFCWSFPSILLGFWLIRSSSQGTFHQFIGSSNVSMNSKEANNWVDPNVLLYLHWWDDFSQE